MEDHIRPAAIRAEITKRLGWHTLRHTFGTWLKANGEDVAVVQSLMRHANVSVTMDQLCAGCDASEKASPARYCGPVGPKWTHESTTAACK